VHPQAPFLKGKKLTIAADCATLSNDNLVKKFGKGESVIIGCPLLEDPTRLMKKLTLVMNETTADEIQVYTMEVPCCHALHMMTTRAMKEVGKTNKKIKQYIVRVDSGEIEPYESGVIDESMVQSEKRAHGHVH
jgi:hypothetical protein